MGVGGEGSKKGSNFHLGETKLTTIKKNEHLKAYSAVSSIMSFHVFFKVVSFWCC